jgi:hypothetical protein
MNKDISEYVGIGEKFCEGECDKKSIIIDNCRVIVCEFCKRVVIDNRTNYVNKRS